MSQGERGVTLIRCADPEPGGSASPEQAGVRGGTSQRPGGGLAGRQKENQATWSAGSPGEVGEQAGCVDGSCWTMEEED